MTPSDDTRSDDAGANDTEFTSRPKAGSGG
jgi:hypothetical protein